MIFNSFSLLKGFVGFLAVFQTKIQSVAQMELRIHRFVNLNVNEIATSQI